MHTNQTRNVLIIEDSKKINFPEEVKEHLSKINWEEQEWNSIGLPAFDSSFSLSGDQLYFERGPDGNPALKQSDFTGAVWASSVLTPEKSENVYVVTVELLFCKGLLCGSSPIECQITSRFEYDIGFKNFVYQQEKALRTIRSRWFRFLYVPYFKAVKCVVSSVVFVFNVVLKSFIWVAEKITPIKL